MSRLLPKLFHRQPPKKLSAVLSTSNCPYERIQDAARYLIYYLLSALIFATLIGLFISLFSNDYSLALLLLAGKRKRSNDSIESFSRIGIIYIMFVNSGG